MNYFNKYFINTNIIYTLNNDNRFVDIIWGDEGYCLYYDEPKDLVFYNSILGSIIKSHNNIDEKEFIELFKTNFDVEIREIYY